MCRGVYPGGCWADEPLDCWAVGLLGCWAVGLLDCWAVGLMRCRGSVSLILTWSKKRSFFGFDPCAWRAPLRLFPAAAADPLRFSVCAFVRYLYIIAHLCAIVKRFILCYSAFPCCCLSVYKSTPFCTPCAAVPLCRCAAPTRGCRRRRGPPSVQPPDHRKI